MNLRSWIKKPPQPVSLRVHLVDGSKDELVIDQKDNRRWARAAESLEAMSILKVDALDPKGKILRTTLVDNEDAPEVDAPAGESTGKPEGESPLGELARHLNVAADQAAKRVAEVVKPAMEGMRDVTSIAVSSLDKASQAIDRLTRRLEQAEARLSAQREQPGEGDVPNMLFQGLLMKQLGPAGAAMMARGAQAASQAHEAPELGELEPTEEEAAEIGKFFMSMMAKRAASKGEAPPPTPPPNGAAQTE